MPFVEPLERSGFDLRLRVRRSAPWPADLVLVPIDDGALQTHGRWPWPRKTTAALLDAVKKAGAKTTLVDFTFVGASTPEDDAALESALKDAVIAIGASDLANQRPADDVLRAKLFPQDPLPNISWDARTFVVPEPRFATAAAGLGHTLSFPSKDLVTRGHMPLIGMPGERGTVPSLALAGLRQQRGWPAADIVFEDGNLRLPGGILELHHGEAYLDWVPDDEPPRRIRAADLLAGTVEDGALEGAMALVFMDSLAAPDRSRMPGGPVPGGLVIATAIKTLDGRRTPHTVRVWISLAAMLFVVLAACGALARLQTRTLVGLALLSPFLFLAGGALLVFIADFFVPVASPSLLLLLSFAALAIRADRIADRERRDLKELLASALANPPSAPQASIEERATMMVLGGESRESTLGKLAAGAPLANPVEIGHYRVTRCLGRGGMGAIFLAEDTKLDRLVALKVLTEQDPTAFERFRREAQAVARIDHPNVVRIFEIGSDADVPFIAIEYVPGGSVIDWFRAYPKDAPWPPPWSKSIGIIRGAAAGLGAAHAAGIIHRDIKPANILLTATGDAKIADFGIAKLGSSATLTREGSMMGTIGYLAPEQALGTEVDPRSDVYSLGVTWYRLLTARAPFDGTTAEILRRQAMSSLPDPRKVEPSIPAAVAELVMRMTNVDREPRPADGNALVREIDEIGANAETQPGSGAG